MHATLCPKQASHSFPATRSRMTIPILAAVQQLPLLLLLLLCMAAVALASAASAPARLLPPSELCAAHLRFVEAVPAVVAHELGVGDLPQLHVVLVLDKSGSMDGIHSDVLAATNAFIAEQQRQQEEANFVDARFSMLQFSDTLQWVRQESPLRHVAPLTLADYSLGGSTALLDAVGTALHRYRHHRNGVLAIVTDGEENASARFDLDAIKRLLACFQAQGGWAVTYVSASVEGFRAGEAMGVSRGSNIAADYGGLSGALAGQFSSVASSAFASSAADLSEDLRAAQQALAEAEDVKEL